MLGLNQYFFNQSIRRYVTIMGTLFSGFCVDRSKGDVTRLQKVPVSFQQKEKFLLKLQSGEKLDPTDDSNPNRKARIATIAPAMSLQMDSMNYSPDKKTAMTNKVSKYKANTTNAYKQMNPVPYRFSFTLSIFTRNLSDQYALLEQILPFFQPSFTCKIVELDKNFIKEDRDVLINLDGVDLANDLHGDVTTQRYLQADLSFSLDGYIYPPMGEDNLIETVFIDFFQQDQTLDNEEIETLESRDHVGNIETGESIAINLTQTSLKERAGIIDETPEIPIPEE